MMSGSLTRWGASATSVCKVNMLFSCCGLFLGLNDAVSLPAGMLRKRKPHPLYEHGIVIIAR